MLCPDNFSSEFLNRTAETRRPVSRKHILRCNYKNFLTLYMLRICIDKTAHRNGRRGTVDRKGKQEFIGRKSGFGAVLFFAEAERLYFVLGTSGEKPPVRSMRDGGTKELLRSALLSPTVLICAAIYAIGIVVSFI